MLWGTEAQLKVLGKTPVVKLELSNNEVKTDRETENVQCCVMIAIRLDAISWPDEEPLRNPDTASRTTYLVTPRSENLKF